MRPQSPTHLKVVASAPPTRIVHVVATRSDAVAMVPVSLALERHRDLGQVIVNAGTGTAGELAGRALADLGAPAAQIRAAGADGGATAAGAVVAETAGAMVAAEAVLSELAPQVVVVAGSSDAAVAWSLAATKMEIPVARLEAGLRDRDWRGEREVNRVLLDTLGDALFATTADAVGNLTREGVGANRVYLVGSTAVDSLRRQLPPARTRAAWSARGLARRRYLLVTLRRTTTEGDDERLARVVEALADLARSFPVVLLLTPEEKRRLAEMGDAHRLASAGVRCEGPLSYLESLSMASAAGAIVTDSGMVQDEATALGVPCFTLRATTERAVTLSHGTNVLLGADPRGLADVYVRPGEPTPCAIPLWDGRAAGRVAEVLLAGYAFARVPRAS